jgi:hypothetical protein
MTRRSVWLIACAFLLASLPSFAQFSTRPDDNGNPGPNYISEGTRFLVRMDNTLESNKIEPGKKFKVKLAEDLVAPNGAIIPAGKKIKGHVSDVERGFHGRVMLAFDEIETRHGWRPLVAYVSDVPGERGSKSVNEEGEIQSKRSNRRMVEEAAAGATIGAVAGTLGGGGKGAAIGAGAGAGAGVAAGLLLDRNLKLQKGQQLELRLDRPLQVPQA